MRQSDLLLGFALFGVLVGCTGAEDNGPPPPTAPTAAEQEKTISDIQNNSNIPSDAKAKAIEGYKAGVARMGTQEAAPPGANSGPK